MTRRGWKCVREYLGERVLTSIDRSPADIAVTMGYGKNEYASAEAFLDSYQASYYHEMQAALRDLLVKNRSVLSIGSGECEIEVPLFRDGYAICGTDIVPEAFRRTQELFPGFRAFYFDIFNPSIQDRFDDILSAGGLDIYYDDAGLHRIFENARGLLKPRGRLLFTLRMHDNVATWLVDYVGMPSMLAALNTNAWLRRRSYHYRLRAIGRRRTPTQIIAMAKSAGFRLGRVRYAGFGGEAKRFFFIRRFFPRMAAWIDRIDRRWRLLNVATVFEFLSTDGERDASVFPSQRPADGTELRVAAHAT